MLGGIIAYSNAAKIGLSLGVSATTIETRGAVSEQAAVEMARGARDRFGADLALSTTGIAGPTGGTGDKPVGLVYIGLSAASGERCERYVWDGDRLENKRMSAEVVLSIFLDHLTRSAAPSIDADTPGMCAISVQSVLNTDGSVRITSFALRDRSVWVTDTGRQWEEPSPRGLKRCVLVMSSDRSTFELCLDGADGLWHLRQMWRARSGVAAAYVLATAEPLPASTDA